MLLSLTASVCVAEQCGAVTRCDRCGSAGLFPEELHARADVERADAPLLGRIPTLSHVALHLIFFEKDFPWALANRKRLHFSSPSPKRAAEA